LCAGASAEQRASHHLADAETFNYLNQSGNVRIEGVDDAADFREVQESMDGLQFTQAEKHSIFTIVAWILHVGNLVFKPAGDKKCEVEGGTGAGSTLSFIAKLMEVSPDALLKSITNRVMVVRGQAPMDISLSVTEAEAARDALSKHTFSRLFDWLVERINKSIGIGAGQKGRSIGILDIFGFEIFELNSFEQLCINFANEKLQQVSALADIKRCIWTAGWRLRSGLTRIGACGCVSFSFPCRCCSSSSTSTRSSSRRPCTRRRRSISSTCPTLTTNLCSTSLR
jgi:myosin-1